MSQPVQPPNPPQQPFGGQPVEGNPYAGQPGQHAPAAPTGNPYGQQPSAPTGNPFAGQQPGQGAPFGGGAPFAPFPRPATTSCSAWRSRSARRSSRASCTA
ncbi:hypothetical protein SBADM41S_02125 [Streptomyces badius]